MRKKLSITATLVCSALAVATTSVPVAAQAQPHHKEYVCRDVSSRGARNTGTAVGAVTGGLLGNALSHGGGKTGGTLLGAGVGAVAGHQIAKHNSTHRECHYEYR